MKVAYFTPAGVKKPAINLSKDIFGQSINYDQLKLAYNRFYANIRNNNAKVLTRAEVSGGGRKPWRQKGTGRARAGSSRSPIWRHGGVAFGPTGKENYTIRLPKKIIRSSLRQALSVQVANIKVVESFTASQYSTQKVIALIDKIGAEGSILVVATKFDPKFYASARNIAGIKLLRVNQLNVAAILNADVILFDMAAIKELEKWLNPSNKPSGENS